MLLYHRLDSVSSEVQTMPTYKTTSKLTGAVSWYCSFYYTDYYGNRKRKKKEGFALKRDADEWERNFLDKLASTPDIPFEVMADNFIEDRKHHVRDSTTAQYKRKIAYLKDFFKDTPTNEITPLQVRKFQNYVSGKYSYKYASSFCVILNSIMDYAMKFHGLQKNPCKLAGTLRKQTDVDPKTKIHFLTHEQFNRLIQHIKRPDKKALFLLLFYSGLRIGEALVLRPQDFNFISNTLTVSRTLSRSETSNVINPPKSKAGNRIIALPSHLMDMLKSLIATNRIDKGQLLFELINRETARRTLVNALKSAGLPKIRIHDLRHSHASLLIELGFSPVAIKERLGHENIQITLDTYSHLYPSKQSEIADKLNSIMKNSTE